VLDFPRIDILLSSVLLNTFQNMAENYSEWMKNTLNLETEDWRKEGDPELDNEGCFHTSAPKIIYQVRLGRVR
jgi:hypothetical protein